MMKQSEMEFRIAREQWHIEMARTADNVADATAHLHMSRRYGDYDSALPIEEETAPE